MTLNLVKTVARRVLANIGYSVRSIDHKDRVSGIELARDVKVVLQGKRDPIVFDVGANRGQTIDLMRETFAHPRIYAFEPSPATFKHLQYAYGMVPGVTLANLALGDTESAALFHVTSMHSVNDSLLQPNWKEATVSVPVTVTTVDNYVREHRLDVIDLLKIDTQGYDLHVLRGAAGMLAAKRVRTLSVELTFVPMYKEQPSFLDILAYVTRHGYRFLGFYEQTYLKNELQYCNACFVTP
jgi:FkbM family methyltransferase